MKLRFLTAGESHGKALVGIVEGIPAGLELSIKDIQKDLKRRKLGYGRGARQKIETDEVEILTGVRHGKTLGSPITLLIWNKDFKNWEQVMSVAPVPGKVKREVHIPRPGHADYVGAVKYNHKDMRNVLERASARETAMRVGLGGIARKFLSDLGIDVGSRVCSIGTICDDVKQIGPIKSLNTKTDKSKTRCLTKTAEKKMVSLIDLAQKNGDTLGGVFEVLAQGVPVGLGSYVHWDKRLEGSIAKSFMSLNAVKGVEIGLGHQSAGLWGSEVHDEMKLEKSKLTFSSNKTGGIIGGMTSGEIISVKASMKPIATLMKPLNSVDLRNAKNVKAHVERSDYCAVPAAAVIGESLLALCLAEEVLLKFGGDSLEEIRKRVDDWRKISE